MISKLLNDLILVTDQGFAPYAASYDEWYDEGHYDGTSPAYCLAADAAPEALIEGIFEAQEVHIPFASSADGRGFSLARRLRDFGYQGRIFATGAVLCDQYRHARQSGFDGVLLTKAQATKMPEPHWLEQARRVCLTYRDQIYA